jgi:hypothetical protein
MSTNTSFQETGFEVSLNENSIPVSKVNLWKRVGIAKHNTENQKNALSFASKSGNGTLFK